MQYLIHGRDGNLIVTSPESFTAEWEHKVLVPSQGSRDARELLKLGSICRELKLAMNNWDIGLEASLSHGQTSCLLLRLVQVIHGCAKFARLRLVILLGAITGVLTRKKKLWSGLDELRY